MSEQFSFNEFPANFYVPGTYVEYDGSKAQQGVTSLPQTVLLIGQRLAAGIATAGVPVRATSADEAGRLAGRGSMLHHMAIAHFAVADAIPLKLLPLSDAGGATKSTRTVTAVGNTAEAGTVALYVGGRRYAANLASASTPTQTAAALVAAIQADDLRFCDAANAAGVITLTARHGGIDAGAISCVLNRYADERVPAGVVLTIGDLTPGAGNPVIQAAVDAVPDQWFPTLIMGFGDAANLTYLGTELTSRNGPVRQIEGVAFVGVNDNVANEIVFAEARNHPFIAPVDAHDSLAPTWVVAAYAGSLQAFSAQEDCARPEQTLPMPGLLAIAEAAGRRTVPERHQLLAAGVGTIVTDSVGVMRLERLTTSYRKNSYNLPDKTRFDVCHERLWAQTRFSWRSRMATKYPRHKLGKNGSRGPNVMTPSLGESEAIAMYTEFIDRGWYEGGAAFAQFKKDVRAVISSEDPNRLNLLFPPDFMNQLRTMGVLTQPRG